MDIKIKRREEIEEMEIKIKERCLKNLSLSISGGGWSGTAVGGLMLRGCESKVCVQVNTDAGKAVFLSLSETFPSSFYAICTLTDRLCYCIMGHQPCVAS